MSTRIQESRAIGAVAATAVAMVTLLAACSQTHVDSAADAATPNGPANASETAAPSDLPEIVIVASREEPRNRG